MAEQLVKYYQMVQSAAGLQGKTRLAMETKIPSTRAALLPDSPENLDLFRTAYEKVTRDPPPKP